MPIPPEQHPCPICGTPYQTGQRYCGNCGALLVITCPVCGTENPAHHRFCAVCGSPLSGTSPPPEKEAIRSAPDERRWVTVLFADISGFTALSERLDPEDVMEFAARSADRISEVIRHFGGTVLRVIGDEVFAVFGAPVAHEDDAERAVRAALAMLDLQLSADPGHESRVHVGVNTGEGLFGKIGPQEVRDFTVMGDMVNTAARLRSAAPPGVVLVGEETHRATRHAIRYRSRPAIQAKGKGLPVAAYQALEVIAAPRERPLGTAPLVGRGSELARLENMFRMVAKNQQPHLVTIIGEPGIGKSRLAAEFEHRLPAPARKLHGRCLPYGESLGYGALAMALKEAAGISAAADLFDGRQKLKDLVYQALEDGHTNDGHTNDGHTNDSGQAAEIDGHLALLAGLDVEQDRQGGPVDQRVQLASLRRFLEAYARRQPLVLNLDDIHWADDALLDLIEYVASRAREAPLLIVTQARPELLEKRPSWGRGVRSFTSLLLTPLDQARERELILELLKERGLPGELLERVGSSASGNPLFAEELVAMIAESGPDAGIPSVIKLLIASRLDALPHAEHGLIQLAAVYGKVFWQGGLRPLGAGTDVSELLESLDQKDLVRAAPASQFHGDREYAFKHDLIRDVAYEMLPRAERRRLHGRAADWLEAAASEQVETYLDQLAHHASQAGQPERALDYLRRAAERAARAGALRQAAALLGQAIQIAEGLGRQNLVADMLAQRARHYFSVGLWLEARQDLLRLLEILPAEEAEQRAAAHLDLAQTYVVVLQTKELRSHSEKALELAEGIGRDDLAAAALANLSVAVSSDGDPRASVGLFERAVQRAHGRLSGPTLAHTFQVIILYWLGHFEQAVAQAEQARQQVHGDISVQLPLYGNFGVALTGLGRYAEAEQVFSEGNRLGREYEVWPYVARTTALSAGYHLDLFDYATNEILAQEARQLARQTNFMSPLVSATLDLLFNYARTGEVGKAERLIPEVAEALPGASGFHEWLWQLRFLQAQAEIALARGEHEEALRLSGQALEQSRLRGRPKYEAFALETRARALAASGLAREAITEVRRAVEVARPTGDPAMFFHAGSELLRLHQDEVIAQETLAAAQKILAALPQGEMRLRFQESESFQFLQNLSR